MVYINNKCTIPTHFKKVDKDFMMDLLFDFGMKKTHITTTLRLQNGGSKEQYIKFIDEGGVYTYKVLENDKELENGQVHVSILTEDERECVTFIIDIDEKVVALHNMSYFKECGSAIKDCAESMIPLSREGLMKPHGGSKLLRFALNMILKYKSKYKFNRILLKDNSYLYCNKCSETVKLADLRMITHGKTWYMKYGFLPYNPNTNKPDKNLLDSIKMNNKIFNIIDTKDVYVMNILNNVIKKEQSLKNIDRDELVNLINKYPKFRDFIIRLNREFDKYCCLLVYLMEVIYDPKSKTGLTRFYNKTFYLDI